jgi:hypothetical protein
MDKTRLAEIRRIAQHAVDYPSVTVGGSMSMPSWTTQLGGAVLDLLVERAAMRAAGDGMAQWLETLTELHPEAHYSRAALQAWRALAGQDAATEEGS